MNRFMLSFVLIFSMYFSDLRAEVWHANQDWNHEWENEYQSWRRKNLHTNVFTSNEGLLGRLSTDCANALYALRIQFA
jgi:hypothetical protein